MSEVTFRDLLLLDEKFFGKYTVPQKPFNSEKTSGRDFMHKYSKLIKENDQFIFLIENAEADSYDGLTTSVCCIKDLPSYESIYFPCMIDAGVNSELVLKDYYLAMKRTINEYNSQRGTCKTTPTNRTQMNSMKNITNCTKGKASKLTDIVEDTRIYEHPFYFKEFEGNFEQTKRSISGYILGCNEVLVYLRHSPETDDYEVNFTTGMNSENSPSHVYFARFVDISDTESAVNSIVKYLDDVSCISNSYVYEYEHDPEEVNENDSKDDFDYGESAYISYIDDIINSLESQIKDTKDKSQKLLLEGAVKNLKAWTILVE